MIFAGILASLRWILCPERRVMWGLCVNLVRFVAKFGGFPLDFYGMKRAWVGAFTDFRGSGYRNPVHF